MNRFLRFGFIIGFWLVTGTALATQQFTILESEKVHYDGKKITFHEGVLLESGFGKMSANRVEVLLEGTSMFSHAYLEEEVVISLQGKGELRSDRANIDGKTHVATFSAGIRYPKVIYTFPLNDGKEGVIQAQTMRLVFFPIVAQGGMSVQPAIGEVHAEGGVEANFPGLGTLTTEKELYLKRNTEKKGELEYLKCTGETLLQCEDEERNIDRHVHCYGEVLLDNEKRQIRFSGPHDGETSQQLFFQEGRAKIYADEAIVEYDRGDDGKFAITHITLEGNARLINREGSLLQYALADHVDIFPQSQEMNFKTFGKKRVLFYDKVNNLQTSAPEMRVKRDETTKKVSFKGVGDVRFNFNEKEFEQLRKRFLPNEK